MGDVASGKADHDSDSDDEHCLTGYGEVSTETPFMLPPSPTQTVKYRYRAYRPKRAGVSKKYRAAKAKSSASLNNKSVSPRHLPLLLAPVVSPEGRPPG